MGKKLLIFTHGGGRLANQLTNHGHWIAFHHEYGDTYDIVNLAMCPYEDLFEHTNRQKVPTLPPGINRWSLLRWILDKIAMPREYKMTFFNVVVRILHLIYHLRPFTQSLKCGQGSAFLGFLPGRHIGDLTLGDDMCLELFDKKRVTLLAGWPFRNWDLFHKYQELIRQQFTFRDDYRKNAETFIEAIREKHSILVGVLIRQTDYRTWNGGNFFFETSEYGEWMKQVTTILGEDVAFVIASDEQQSQLVFEGLSVYFSTGQSVGPNHFIESFAELSMCDYVLTAPSTFGIWAAFLGDVPLIPVFEKGQKLIRKSFLENHIFDAIGHSHLSIAMK